MAGKHITPDQKLKALTLRSAGYTIAVIADKTGVSVTTLKRLFSKHGVSRGKLKEDAVNKATAALINDASAINTIKREVASMVTDDIAQFKRFREAMAEATEQLTASDTTEALQMMRAISAGAVAFKSTSETLRKSLGMDKDNEVSDDLPELTISIMTTDEIDTIKDTARQRALGLDDGLGNTLDEESDVIEYTSDEGVTN